MDVAWLLALALLAALVLLAAACMKYRGLYLLERSKAASLRVKNGKTMENLIPLMKGFPGDPRKFRFIGDPIDGILFGENSIVFMEFKTGKSSLSQSQRRVRDLVKSKNVRWKEIRIS